MILERFYDDKLAQASYLVGCAATGEALVVDPNRDAGQYIAAARRHGVTITHVTETHIHADYVSGSREIGHRADATLYLSDEGGEGWRYAFAEQDHAVLLKDGDTFMVGNVKVEAVHTPGHTPEHMIFLITDTAAAAEPMGAFTGDFVFVGALGRPDLLEKAAKVEGTMEAAARDLYQSVQKFRDQPEYLQIWPGHGAGSACGKALGAIPQSTWGYEKRFNPALQYGDEESFVAYILEGQPSPPKYFAEMKRINRDGPAILGDRSSPPRQDPSDLGAALGSGALVLDVRSATDFASGHAAGTVSIPLVGSFTTWAGWLVPYHRDFYLLVDAGDVAGTVEEAVRDLAMIGLDRVAGFWTSEALDNVRGDGALETTPQMDVGELSRSLTTNGLAVLDVREDDEWEAGHLPGVRNIPLGYLVDRLDEVPEGRPLVVHCRSGARSAMAASLLQKHGVEEVVNLAGGFLAWTREGLPIER